MERIKPTLMAVMLAFLSISTTTCATEAQTRTFMYTHHSTLWQLIEALIKQPSFDEIRQVLPIEFIEYQRRATFSFYKGGPLHLADQIVIKKATLVIEHKDETSSMIGLDLSPAGTCVTLADLHVHYPNTEIIGHPRGGSLDEKTYWAVRYPWGRLAFGFKEGNPHCLASVGIRRNDQSPTSSSP